MVISSFTEILSIPKLKEKKSKSKHPAINAKVKKKLLNLYSQLTLEIKFN